MAYLILKTFIYAYATNVLFNCSWCQPTHPCLLLSKEARQSEENGIQHRDPK